MEILGPGEKLTMARIESCLEQINEWEKKILLGLVDSNGLLPKNCSQQVDRELVSLISRETPRLLPLALARIWAGRALKQVMVTPVGEPMTTDQLRVSGHTSGSVLWLWDAEENKLQTMQRLLVDQSGNIEEIDVYSEPIYPGFKKSHGGVMSNAEATETSRALNLLRHVESKGTQIKGWVEIDEISERRVPTYGK